MNASDGMTAVVLAGGRALRFGGDKSLVLWGGKPVVVHLLDALKSRFQERLIVTKEPGLFAGRTGPGERVVPDHSAFHHPLVGLASGLAHSATLYNFVCACDMPLLDLGLVSALCEAAPGWDAAVPVWNGRPQPLAAVYSRDCLEALSSAQAQGVSLMELLRRVRTRFLPEAEVAVHDPFGRSFEDIDTWADYRRVRELSLACAH
ncbi:MAG: molybdenum cofactor guanylyltransferase [Elusimicrobia bacterium]|nr:molybdenum cofactor guanylyltransferase [Elusimicrobiota bacterium]